MNVIAEAPPVLRVHPIPRRERPTISLLPETDIEGRVREDLHLNGLLVHESGKHGIVAMPPTSPHSFEEGDHMVYWVVDLKTWKTGAVEVWTDESWKKVLADTDLLHGVDMWIAEKQLENPRAIFYSMIGYTDKPGSVQHSRFGSGLQSQSRMHIHELVRPLSTEYHGDIWLKPGDKGYKRALEMQMNEAEFETIQLMQELLAGYGSTIRIRHTIGRDNPLTMERHVYGFTLLEEAILSTWDLLHKPEVTAKWDEITEIISKLKIEFAHFPDLEVQLHQFAVASAMIVFPTEEMRRMHDANDPARIWSFPFAVNPFSILVENGIRLIRA